MQKSIFGFFDDRNFDQRWLTSTHDHSYQKTMFLTDDYFKGLRIFVDLKCAGMSKNVSYQKTDFQFFVKKMKHTFMIQVDLKLISG